MSELTAEDIVDIESMRQRLGLKEDDTSRDAFIIVKTPMQRVRLGRMASRKRKLGR